MSEARTKPARALVRFRPRTVLAVPLVLLVLFGGPLFLGGAPATAAPLWAMTALLALAISGVDLRAALKDPWARVGALVVGLSVFQLVPLPPILLRGLDPAGAALTAGALEVFGEDRSGAWRALHTDPGTGLGFTIHLVGVFAAYLAARRLAYRGFTNVLLHGASFAALWVAGVAWVHAAWGLDKIYGIYTPRGQTALLSCFVNPNHLAAFTGAGAVLWAGRAAAAEVAAQRIMYATGAFVCASVCALSLSRGGIAAATGGMLVFLASLLWLRQASQRRSSRAFTNSLYVIAFVCALAGYLAADSVSHEFVGGDLSKVQFFAHVARALRAHWLFGAGVGSAPVAVANTGALAGDLTAEWGESLPLDLSLSFGVPMAVVILVLGGWALLSQRPSPRSVGLLAFSAYCAFGTLVVHDLADASLWYPGVGYLAAVLAGVLTGEAALRSEALDTRPRAATRWLPLLALALTAPAVLPAARDALYLTRERVQASVIHGGLSPSETRAILLRHPADAFLPLALAAADLRGEGRNSFRYLNRALRLAPAWGQPHVLLASELFRRGLRPQALLEVRLGGSQTNRYDAPLAQLLLHARVQPDELAAAVPPGARGIELLRYLAPRTSDTELLATIDGELRKRSPDDFDVMMRDARRAREAGDAARATETVERAVARHRLEPRAYLALAEDRIARGNGRSAEETLRRALELMPNESRLLAQLAEYQARRSATAEMRATMALLFEAAGADIDARVQAYGQLGRLERALRNEGESLAAFERGDAMAYPAHPYLSDIFDILHRMGDQRRLRSVCETLMSDSSPTTEQRDICAETTRAAAPF